MAEEHKQGSMDITEQEKTFEGFMKWTINSIIVIFFIAVFLAIFRT